SNMGRLPKNGLNRKNLDANILKCRHRHADTKYRSNVQYLYSKLKEMSRSKSAKGNVLSDSLLFIQSLENDIVDKVGTDQMKMYQDEFSNFLLHEEAMWKIKDTVKWWDKVEETLDSQENFSLEFSIDKADFPNTEWSHNSPLWIIILLLIQNKFL
ncbi:uncharacterized protein CDAR_192841, partial [Caerostris darwini]